MTRPEAYIRLPATPADSDESAIGLLEYDGEESTPSSRRSLKLFGTSVSEDAAWKTFVSCCVAAIAISAINLSFLSLSGSIHSARISSKSNSAYIAQLKRPSVYLGLEKISYDRSQCRSRETYPKTFFTYDLREGPSPPLQHIHAPEDQMTLTFGGPIRAVVDTYIPDYGLENCTLSLQRAASSEQGHASDSKSLNVDVYLLPSPLANDRSASVFLDTLAFASGKTSTSKPFYCPSRSNVYFEWRCPAGNCLDQLSIPLEGVTAMTASSSSVNQTGFRITQYEALSCISE